MLFHKRRQNAQRFIQYLFVRGGFYISFGFIFSSLVSPPAFAGFTGFIEAGNFNEADTFPLPPMNRKMLFYLQRTPNTNTIIYELNYRSNGQLHKDEPIHVYWIRFGEPGHPKKELSYIQKRFAYGLKVKQEKEEQWDVRLVSYDKIALTLKKGRDGNFKVFVRNKDRTFIFQKAYIKIDGGTLWSPNVIYIELTGIDEVTKEKVSWRVYP